MVQQRALVADDDANLLEVVAFVIRRLGVEVVPATTGGELLEKVANDGPFDLIVTDVAMPWMTGLQVMHSARAAGLTCPVIVMTAMRDDRTSEQIAGLGAIHLRKPFSVTDLREAVRGSLGMTSAPAA